MSQNKLLTWNTSDERVDFVENLASIEISYEIFTVDDQNGK